MKMVEKVARAICPDWWHDVMPDGRYPLDNYPGQHLKYREKSLEQARKAIEAMREPTDAMDAAARDECHKMAGCIDPVIHIWDRMLDTALDEPR